MDVRIETRDGVGLLTLARPEKLNAMTPEMGAEIQAAVQAFNAAADVRAVLVRGEGRAFSAGGDLEFLRANARRSVEENERGMRAFYEQFLALRDLAVPSVAVLHGRATGAGLMVALGCDMRVASEDARVAANFVRVGLNPGMGATFLLERLVGPGRAAELLYTGRDVAMGEALAIGLVNHVVQADRLEEAAWDLARAIAQNAPVAVRRTKAILGRGVATLGEALALEAEGQAACFASEDLLEGIRAVQERRRPRFSGR